MAKVSVGATVVFEKACWNVESRVGGAYSIRRRLPDGSHEIRTVVRSAFKRFVPGRSKAA